MLFSQRKGLKPVKSVLQIDSMDEDLRNGLWNALTLCYWDRAVASQYGGHYLLSLQGNKGLSMFCIKLWDGYFKKPVDKMGDDWSYIRSEIRNYFYSCPWNEVYDFIEFTARAYPDSRNGANNVFIESCNTVFETELSGYRFVGGIITQITSEQEIEAVENALASPDPFKPVGIHIKTALGLFSDRKSPDYRNSIKESISAVESACKIVTDDTKATLGKALENVSGLHGALKKSFEALYGYTSDAEGIRHALLDEPSLDFEDAKFMLVSCSAFVNYLISKQAKQKKNEK